MKFHTYPSAGVYTIKIDSPSQSIQGWSLHGGTSQVNNYDGRKLIDLKQWGYFDFAGNKVWGLFIKRSEIKKGRGT